MLPAAARDIARMHELGFGTAPCAWPRRTCRSATTRSCNRPHGFRLPVRGVLPSAGAGFVVVLCGDMQRMPGLGRTPNFTGVDIDGEGRTTGLF